MSDLHAAHTILTDAFDDPDIHAITEETRGNIKTVYAAIITADGERRHVHVSLDVESPPSGDPVEPAMTSLANDVSIPTPTHIASAVEADPSYLVAETIPGRNLIEAYPEMSLEERRDILHQIGAYTGKLHNAFADRFDTHGWLALDADNTLRPARPRTSWRQFYRRSLKEKYTHLPLPLKWLIPVIERHVDKHSDLLSGAFTPVISHGDLRPENIILTDDGTATPIDWHVPYACHDEFGIVKVECMFIDKHVSSKRERQILREELYSGYTRNRPLPSAFQRRRQLYRIPWFIFLAGRPEEVTAYSPNTAYQLNRFILTNVVRNLTGQDTVEF